MRKAPEQALNILTRIVSQAQRTYEESNAQEGNLQAAYQALWQILERLTKVSANAPKRTDVNTSARLAIIANAVQSLDIVKDVIFCGYYFAAVALTRQLMEAVTRLGELRKEEKLGRGRAPNVGHLPMNMAVNYGRLSDIAHSGMEAGLGRLAAYPGESDTVSLSPVYNAHYWEQLFALHIENFLVLICEWHELQREVYAAEQVPDILGDLEGVLQLLVDAGHLKLLEP